MSEQEILALAQLVKETSEALWQFALIKVYADAVQNIVWVAVFFVSLVGTSFGSLRSFQVAKKRPQAEWDVLGWCLAICAGLSLVVIGGFLAAALGRLIAPQWFAIRILIGMTA